ncbi:MAG: DUF6452 family protein [Bacteroidales bacterium]|jgi:hypothetical protein|nr:DUF6452 family protein [Bacteroidales bacterium]
MRKSIILLLFSIIIISVACEDDKCITSTDTRIKTSFFIEDTNLVEEDVLSSLAIYSPQWTDSIYYSQEGISNSLKLQLSPTEDISEYVFSTLGYNDTLTFYYNCELLLISPECGFITNYNIDSLKFTKYQIDSIKLIQTSVSNIDEEHIQIYY